MLIDFEAKQTFSQTLDVVDPGNCCIRCENEKFDQWYLVIKTIRGRIHYLEFGPVQPDTSDLCPESSIYYGQMKFNEKKVYSLISKFLNDPKREISNATEDIDENAFEDIPDFGELFRAIN